MAVYDFSVTDDYMFDDYTYLTTLHTFEYVSATVSRSGMQMIADPAVSNSFFDQFADLLERLTNTASVLIASDLNIHVNDNLLAATIKFNEILVAHNLIQNI